MGAGPLKKGAVTPLSRKIGVPAKIIIPKCTDRVFLRYRFGKYREIPTEYRPKIPKRYTQVNTTLCTTWGYKYPKLPPFFGKGVRVPL
jgi:hypothetical protein